MIIQYYKKIGESMNELIDRFREEYKCDKITYAGKLDPIANGIVTILTDDDIYSRDKYMNKDKIYRFKLIHTITTDTYDILGLLNSEDEKLVDSVDDNKEYDMEYPPYSSYKIKGKPLWYYTLNNIKFDNKPSKKIKLHYLKKINEEKVDKDTIIDRITKIINKVNKNTFRQESILKSYENLKKKEYTISEYEIKLSSGGFVRYFGNMMNGTCYNIERISYE
jgi:tRNA U55 pseudouridine synthase TruB